MKTKIHDALTGETQPNQSETVFNKEGLVRYENFF